MSNYIKWDGISEDGSDGDKKWINANLTWGDYQFISEVADVVDEIEAGGGSLPSKRKKLDKWLDQEPEKKKRLIKLICMVKGEKFEETKEVEELTINIKDVEFVIEEVLSKIKNIIVEKKDV